MNLNEFDAWTKAERTDTSIMDIHEAVRYNILCLSSEAGEVSDVLKRAMRGDYSRRITDYREDILLELGDVLHYVCRIADDHGFTLQEVVDANVEKLTNRKKYGKGNKGKRS
jgi:NTP pyrophosphatase (non-canonical NTP hydrolase)